MRVRCTARKSMAAVAACVCVEHARERSTRAPDDDQTTRGQWHDGTAERSARARRGHADADVTRTAAPCALSSVRESLLQ